MKVYIFNILRSKMCDNSNTKAKKGLVEHCSDQWGIFRYCSYFFSELYLFKLESMTACFHWFPKIPSWILPEVSLNESQALIPSAENRGTWTGEPEFSSLVDLTMSKVTQAHLPRLHSSKPPHVNQSWEIYLTTSSTHLYAGILAKCYVGLQLQNINRRAKSIWGSDFLK